MFNFIKIISLLLSLLLNISYADSNLFPVKGNIRVKVDFWKKVYTQINSNESYIHDANDLSIIYKKVKLPESKKARMRFIKSEKKKLKKILYSIAKNKTKNLNSLGQKVLGLVAEKSTKEIYEMAKNIRFQYGLKDRYYKGLIRSYKYLDFIKKTYKDLSLPEELSYLPHVESSFNYKAYSKVGAAGIWQFMRSTARLYGLKVNYIIDERRDPIKATKAAARLLRDNFKRLESWPLALTAYNHGAQSLLRAIKKLGTNDINTIVEKYRGRRFGFASKNFYATFMATVEISKNPEKYFRAFKKPKVFRYSTIKLKKRYTINQIKKALTLSDQILKKYNFEIRPKAFKSPLYLPKGFLLKLPSYTKDKLTIFQNKVDRIKSIKSKDYIEHMHIVSRGETLFDISQIYRVDMHKIIAFNELINPSKIFPGKKLKIPGKKTKIKKQHIVSTKSQEVTKKLPELKQGNLKDKEVYKKNQNLFDETFAKILSPTKHNNIDMPLVFINTPEINLSSYNFDIKKLRPGLYQINIETEETIGHYCDWGLIRSKSIKNLNFQGSKSNISFGKKLKIPLKDHLLNRFKEKRNEYHLSIQEDFYSVYHHIDYIDYIIKQGDSIHSITQKFNIPFWALRKYQNNQTLPDVLKIGSRLIIPKFEKVEEESSLLPEEDDQQ